MYARTAEAEQENTAQEHFTYSLIENQPDTGVLRLIAVSPETCSR